MSRSFFRRTQVTFYDPEKGDLPLLPFSLAKIGTPRRDDGELDPFQRVYKNTIKALIVDGQVPNFYSRFGYLKRLLSSCCRSLGIRYYPNLNLAKLTFSYLDNIPNSERLKISEIFQDIYSRAYLRAALNACSHSKEIVDVMPYAQFIIDACDKRAAMGKSSSFLFDEAVMNRAYEVAALHGNSSAVKAILECKSYKFPTTHLGYGLMRAATFDHLSVVRVILEKARNLPIEDDSKLREYALDAAVRSGGKKVIREIVTTDVIEGISQAALDEALKNALRYRGSVEVFQMLLDARKANGETVSQKGLDEALKIAAGKGALDYIKILVKTNVAGGVTPNGRALAKRNIKPDDNFSSSWDTWLISEAIDGKFYRRSLGREGSFYSLMND